MPFDRSSRMRCFMTPPPTRMSRQSQSPTMLPLSERKRSSPVNKGDLFHVIHKVPAGDSPYVKAKQVQLVDKDPSRAISKFWAAINAGDRVESALKDMALVMKQLDRSDEAIEAIKSFRHLCPSESQESLDNILVELYKRSGRIDEEIAMLQHKLKQIEDGVAFVGRRTKQARSQGKKIQITVEQEISRILGNLAWAYLQKGDFKTAEEHYRKALSFEPDRNKQCNLAICLIQMNRITEAKFLLQAVSASSKNRKMDESFAKSFERAYQMLIEIQSQSVQDSIKEEDDECKETQSSLMSNIHRNSKESNSPNVIGQHHTGLSISRNWENEGNQVSQLVDRKWGESFCQNSLNNKGTTFVGRTLSQCFPQSRLIDEQKRDSYIENFCGRRSSLVKSRKENWTATSEVEVSCTRQRLYESPDPAIRDLKVPYSEPKRCLWGFNDGYQRRENWGDVNSDHKTSFGRSLNEKFEAMLQSSETDLPSTSNRNWKGRMLGNPATVKCEDKTQPTLNTNSTMKFPDEDTFATDESTCRTKLSESPHMVSDGAKEIAASIDTQQNQSPDISVSNSDVNKSFGNNKSSEDSSGFHVCTSANRKPSVKKSWADMAEEEEEEDEDQDLFGRRNTYFGGQDKEEAHNDENVNLNIIYQSPCPQGQTECLSQKLETFELKDGSNASGSGILSRNPTVRRSLCFNQQLTPESTDFFRTSTSSKKALNLEGHRMLSKERDCVSKEKRPLRRNRLQVFRDITLQSSP